MTEGPAQSVPVHRAHAFRVTNGANMGDPISFIDEIALDDIYEFAPEGGMERLSFVIPGTGPFRIAQDTGVGRPGAELHLDCAISLMSGAAQLTEALILVELDAAGMVAEVYLLPLAPLQPETEYTLVGAERHTARQKLAQVTCVSFTRGTHITMADGRQVPIEDLRLGDRVLTRDAGAQPVRWIGQSTLRATGAFAPVMIAAGTLNNTRDLVVSPDHRLFVYQRTDRIGAGQPEILVKARHLVNGETVRLQEGGFVDYFQLLFDRHHIVYAEGIAAESLLIDPRTRPALPEELIERMREVLPEHERGNVHGLDVQKALLDRPDAIELLRRASTR